MHLGCLLESLEDLGLPCPLSSFDPQNTLVFLQLFRECVRGELDALDHSPESLLPLVLLPKAGLTAAPFALTRQSPLYGQPAYCGLDMSADFLKTFHTGLQFLSLS